jgi:hypothetical protein
MRLLELIRNLQAMLSGEVLGKLIELLRTVNVRVLFSPPDIRDGWGCRAWLQEWLSAGKILATISETELDDRMVGFLTDIVNDDATYPALHGLIVAILDNVPPTAEVAGELELVKAANAAGIDWLTVVGIIKAIIDLAREFGWLKGDKQ